MSLKELTKEQLQEMSLIEIAYEFLADSKQPLSFYEIRDEIAKILNLSEQELNAKIAQFYTDLNIDGRFLSLGENRWGLRAWYPVDHVEEEVAPAVKPKKKKAKKVVDEDELEDFDELEDEDDLDYDDLDDLDDTDDLLDDEEDFDDELEDLEDDLGDELDEDLDADLDEDLDEDDLDDEDEEDFDETDEEEEF